MRPSLMQDSNMINKEYNDIEDALIRLLNTKGWTADKCQIIFGADINNNYNGDTYRDKASIKLKSKNEIQMQAEKVVAVKMLLSKFGLSDTYRCKKNDDNDKAGFTFNPRRIT